MASSLRAIFKFFGSPIRAFSKQFRRFPQFCGPRAKAAACSSSHKISFGFSAYILPVTSMARQPCRAGARLPQGAAVFACGSSSVCFLAKASASSYRSARSSHIDFLPGSAKFVGSRARHFQPPPALPHTGQANGRFRRKGRIGRSFVRPWPAFRRPFSRAFSALPRLVKTDKRQATGLQSTFSAFLHHSRASSNLPLPSCRRASISGYSASLASPVAHALRSRQRARLVAAPQPRLGQGLARLKRLFWPYARLFQQPEAPSRSPLSPVSRTSLSQALTSPLSFFQRFFPLPAGRPASGRASALFLPESPDTRHCPARLAKDGAHSASALIMSPRKAGRAPDCSGRVAHMGGPPPCPKSCAIRPARAFHIPAVHLAMAKICSARPRHSEQAPAFSRRPQSLLARCRLRARAGSSTFASSGHCPRYISGGFRQSFLFGRSMRIRLSSAPPRVGCGCWLLLSSASPGLVRAPEPWM